jgi:hypothetical protein
MSIFRSMTVTCPACDETFDMQAADSVNADRRPDLRDEILAGTFQVEACPKCAETFRLDPRMSFVDIARGQWISVQPLEGLGDWPEDEVDASETFALAYGTKAPPSARDIGEALRPRLVYGWAALREKLVLAEHQLDDVALELTKLALIQGLGDAPLGEGVDLRLEAVAGDDFEMLWINAQNEEVIEALRVPRALYDGILADPQAWASLHQALSAGPFVDLQKQILGLEEPAAA